jgi:hypothetical protein
MAIPRNLANLANQLNADGDVPKIEVNDSKVEVTDTGSNGTIVFNTDGSERMRVTSGGLVGIGTSSPSTYTFTVENNGSASVAKFRNNSGVSGAANALVEISSTRDAVLDISSSTARFSILGLGNTSEPRKAQISYNNDTNILTITSNNAERARISSDGNFVVGKTTVSFNTVGVLLGGNGSIDGTRAGGNVLNINRLTNDGNLVEFYQDTTLEGTISVSGNTVSYNAFTGGHWTQLQEGRGYNPDIPRGTVMSSIGEMAVWKSVEWTETIEHPATEEKEAWTESISKRESYLGNLDVGATFEEDGFTKTVVDDGNERLPKVKISDVVGDKAIYGVFQTWDEVEDMLITSLGAFVVRIAAGVTVEIGDLLESNGDGCAKVQDDDIIRSKTIGKVTSTVATATYDDGSYTVPCVIYCG